MCPLKLDLLSVTFDPETAEIPSVIVTHHSAAITLQPSKLQHVYSLVIISVILITMSLRKKTVPTLACYNVDKHQPILLILTDHSSNRHGAICR